MIGDAAHATTPNMARGAGEAVEDALALARELGSAPTLDDRGRVEAALRAFETQRRPETAKVQKAARRTGKTASLRNPLACAFRDQLMQRVAGKAIVKQFSAEAAELGRASASGGGETKGQPSTPTQGRSA